MFKPNTKEKVCWPTGGRLRLARVSVSRVSLRAMVRVRTWPKLDVDRVMPARYFGNKMI